MTAVAIRAMRPVDAKQVLAIYQAGMDTPHLTSARLHHQGAPS